MTEHQCPRCGHRSASAARFCANCGTPLTAEGSAETTGLFSVADLESKLGGDPDHDLGEHRAAVRGMAKGVGLLVVRRGATAGSRFLLDRRVTSVGRHADSDIFLDDVTVSRKHAEFRRDGTGHSVYDLGSLNGIYVNGRRVDEAALKNGDLVQIGKFRLTFLTG